MATQWVEQVLRAHGWPAASYRFLAQLQTHLGDQLVEHYDCEVLDADTADVGHGDEGPDSTARIVVFTATHLFVQTVDCTWRTRRLAVGLQVLPRSSMSALESQVEEELHIPGLRRLHDWLDARFPWLAGLVQRLGATELLRPSYDLEEPDGQVVVDVRYAGLRGLVLTLPMSDDEEAAERLAGFLPSLVADLT